MDIESIVRELRVDWENLISEDFDPIPLMRSLENESSVDASSFRNIYHKVKQAMDKIIETNFKVFSDSVLLYSKIYQTNKENLRCIDTQIDFCNEVLNTDLTMDTDKKDVKKNMWIRVICEAVGECKALLENTGRAIHDRKYVYASTITRKFFDVYAKYRLHRVTSVGEMLEKARRRRLVLIDALCTELRHFMCDNSKLEYVEVLDAVISLGGLGILDTYFHKNISIIIMDAYKDIINESVKLSSQDSICTAVQGIMHITGRMFSKFLSIAAHGLDNTTEVVESKFFQTETESVLKIFNKRYAAAASEVFLKNLEDIANTFSFPRAFLKKEGIFNIEDIQGSTNYGNMLDEGFSVAGQSSADSVYERPHSTVCIPFVPDIGSLFYFAENIDYLEESELKTKFQSFLSTQIEEKYFIHRNNRIERKLIVYLKESGGYYGVSNDGYLDFFCMMDFEYIFYKKEHNSLGFFNFVFEIIGRKLKVLFYKIFDKRLTTKIICRGDEIVLQNVPENLKKHLASEPIPAPHSKSKYTKVLAAIKTIKGMRAIYVENVVPMTSPRSTAMQRTLKSRNVGESASCEESSTAHSSTETKSDEKDTKSTPYKNVTTQPAVLDLYDTLLKAYEEGCKIEFVSDAMYFFDLFCRKVKGFYPCIKNISNIISNIQESADNDEYFEYLFGATNFYVRSNSGNLDFRRTSEIHNFIKDLILLDDVLCDIKRTPKDNLYESVDFLKGKAGGGV